MNSTLAFKEAISLSSDYCQGRLNIEAYRLSFLKAYLHFSPKEIWYVASLFVDKGEGEG